MSDLVESAVKLQEALDRVRVAKARWTGYAGNPTSEICDELLNASEAVRLAVVALTGGKE